MLHEETCCRLAVRRRFVGDNVLLPTLCASTLSRIAKTSSKSNECDKDLGSRYNRSIYVSRTGECCRQAYVQTRYGPSAWYVPIDMFLSRTQLTVLAIVEPLCSDNF